MKPKSFFNRIHGRLIGLLSGWAHVGLVTVVLAAAGSAGLAASGDSMWVYFGTYTGAKSKGIYVSRFDSATGKLGAPELAAESRSPSFLALHPTGSWLYAAG